MVFFILLTVQEYIYSKSIDKVKIEQLHIQKIVL